MEFSFLFLLNLSGNDQERKKKKRNCFKNSKKKFKCSTVKNPQCQMKRSVRSKKN